MGKVNFPLINVRKDVTNQWHMTHFTGETVEIIEVPSFSDENGYYTAWLKELPDSGAVTVNYTTTPPIISGLTEFRGQPVDNKTRRIKINPTQFYVNYQTGEILFHPNQAGKKFKVDYWGRGSLIEADDINYLNNRIDLLERQRITSEFTKFEIEGQETIIEIGDKFPNNEDPHVIKFIWETAYSERLIPESIQIYDVTNDQILVNKLNDIGEYELEYHQQFTLSKPGEQRFRISAEVNNGTVISSDYVIEWVDRVYWLCLPEKEITSHEIGACQLSTLLSDNTKNHEINIKFPYSSQNYKVLAIPDRYKLIRAMDVDTEMRFVFDEPIKLEVLSSNNNISVKYKVYFSSCDVSSECNIKCEIGEDNG